MAENNAQNIRNVALVGHSGNGKTMLSEAMLLKGGEINRLGRIGDGTTASDFDTDEKEGQKSVHSSVLHTMWKGRDINIIDTPGAADFVGEVYGALSVVELAVITVNAAAGIEVGTRKAWDLAQQQGCACMFVITRMDADNAQYDEVVASLQENFGAACTPLMLPVGSGSSFSGIVNLLHPGDIPSNLADTVEEQRGVLMESVISGDDALLERYLEGETIPQEELEHVFVQVLVDGSIVPILCCAAESDQGITEIMDFIAGYAPSPDYAAKEVLGDSGAEAHSIDLGGPLEAQVFKIISDEFVGKVSYFRVYSGLVRAGDTITLAHSGRPVKIPKLFRPQAKTSGK